MLQRWRERERIMLWKQLGKEAKRRATKKTKKHIDGQFTMWNKGKRYCNVDMVG